MKTRVDKEWFKNGKIKSEYNYKIGFSIPFTPFFRLTFNVKEDGIVTHWYENGQKKEETIYKFGKEISSKEWNEDGSVKERLNEKNNPQKR